jgi:hypothetical protein
VQANRHPQKTSLLPEIIIEIIAEDPCLPSPLIVNDPEEECGYTGGVNVSWSDSESDYELSEDEWNDSETESLAELEGDELENT